MNEKDMIFFMESRHKTELNPQKKIPDSENDLYKTNENDNCDYTQNTTAQD